MSEEQDAAHFLMSDACLEHMRADDERLGICEGCDGSGIRRVPAEPSCEFEDLGIDWAIVERCDTCQIYPDDLAASLRIFHEAKWINCLNGGWHAVGTHYRASEQ